MAAAASTFLMFEGDAAAAMRFYVSLFPDGAIDTLHLYGPGEAGPEGSVQHATFRLAGQRFACIDSPAKHGFTFTPATSLFITCDTAEELDRLHGALLQGGQELMPLGEYPFAQRYGWLIDRFGLSWQLSLPPTMTAMV